MIFLFSSDDGQVHSRSRYLRGGLLRNFHRIRVVRNFSEVPSGDMWLHGLSRDPTAPLDGTLCRAMAAFKGKIAFYQNDDGCEFFINRIPVDLRDRAVLFLRNHWPADENLISLEIRTRTGFINPLLKPLAAKAGPALRDRPIDICFYGSFTGNQDRGRDHALKLLKQAGIPYTGGLIEYVNVPQPPADCAVPAISSREHGRLLSMSKICLALHGNCALTYRFFEGMSRRCLVLAQELASIRFAGCGLKPGVHYVSVKDDLSDLVEKARHFLDHIDEAQKIADAGFEHFSKNFAFSGVNLPQPLFEEIVSSWKNFPLQRGQVTVKGLATRWFLPVIHSL